MKLPTVRNANLLALLFCIGMLAYATYAQFVLGIEPCPLCITQRIIVLFMALILLLLVLHNPKQRGATIYYLLLTLSSFLGAFASGRQTYLQLLPPDQTPACGPGITYMLQTLPLTQTLKVLVTGTGDCAKVDWRFLTLSMAEWMLIIFLGFVVFSMIQLKRSS